MSAEYNPALPTDKDWVRFLIGDRTTSSASLSDEEIQSVLNAESNKFLAAARCGEAILAKGRGAVSKAVGDLNISYGDSPTSSYRNHLTALREQGSALTWSRPRVFRVLGTRD